MNPSGVDHVVSKGYVLFVTTLAGFLSAFGVSSVNIALPSIGKEFQMDAIVLSWIVTAYLLPSAIFPVPFGKIADLYGRKKIFIYGVVTFTLASVGCSISTSAVSLICFRIFQGVGSAAIYCVGTAILTSVFPSGELGKALGTNLAAIYFGYCAGPFLGGYVTHHFGWRSIFFVNVFVGFLVICSVFWKLKGEWLGGVDDNFDLAGSIIYGIALFLLLYGFSQLSSVMGVSLVLLGAIGILIFIKWEMGVKNPILEIDLFKNNKAFAFSNLAALINYAATFAVTFLLSLYLQYIKNLTPEKAGLILLSQPIVQTFLTPLSGKLSDRIEPRVVASTGMIVTALGLVMLTLLNERTSVEFIVASLILLGLGFALFVSPNTNAVMRSVENRFYGVASGTLGTMRMVGMAFSMGITILVFSFYIGKVQITTEYYPLFLRCLKLTFSLLVALCFGGVFASLAGGNVAQKKEFLTI